MTTCQHYQPNRTCGAGKFKGTVSPGVCRACQGLPAPDATCPPDTDWCEKYGLPTGRHACEVCTEAKAYRDADPECAPWFMQTMRDVGRLYGALVCKHRIATGRTIERRCCGGAVKSLPVYACALTGRDADCRRCHRRTPATL